MNVGKGVTQGVLGFVLDALAPEGPLDPLSYAFFIILLVVILTDRIPAWAKVVLAIFLVFAMFFSPLEIVPGVDGLDGAVVMGIAGAMSSGGVASFRYCGRWS